MAKLRLSKNSLQQQQQQLKLYKRLLPSLDLKRASSPSSAKNVASYTALAASGRSMHRQELPMLADEIELSGWWK
jgi:V/A-type H+-transporting ATPase subunit D